MGLADLQREGAKPDELWKTAVNAKTGESMPWIKECDDIVRLDKEEPEVGKVVYGAVNTWLAQDPANKAKLQDFKQGFSMNHEGMVYRVIQFKDGHLKVSRWKQKSASGGFGKGGFQRQPFIHLKTQTVQMVHFEELKALIDNQEDQDNWKVTFLNAMDPKAGPLFLVENFKPYNPKVDNVSGNAEEESKEENETERQE